MIIPGLFGFNCPSGFREEAFRNNQTVRFLFRYKIRNGGYGRTWFNIGHYEKNVSKRFFSETTVWH
jgi:hypothetical protein